MSELRNAITKKKVPENENLDQVIVIVEKILNFNRQQTSKELKILTLKRVLQRLAVALAQVKPGNTSECFLNELRQTI